MAQRKFCKYLLILAGLFFPIFLSANLYTQALAEAGLENMAQSILINPTLDQLKNASIKRATIAYFPYESQHWELVRQAAGEEKLSSVYSIPEYLDGLERLGFVIESRQLVRAFAFYPNQQALFDDELSWPVELSDWERKKVSELATMHSLPSMSRGAVNFPYKLLVLIVTPASQG